MRKSIISKVFMTIVACMFCMQTALAADTWSYPSKAPDGKFGGGSGTELSPYLISNAQQLADLAYLVNKGTYYKGKYFKLTADITLNDVEFGSDNKPTNTSSLKLWTPIGKYGRFWNDRFKGILNGDNHTISGLVCNIGDNDYKGLFGALDEAIVRNLTIKDSYMYTTGESLSSGFLVGYMAKSQIVNCHVVNSNIYGDKVYGEDGYSSEVSIGGIVGQGSGKGKSMTSCSYSGTIYLDGSKIGFKRNNVYVAGLMALGAPTLNDCRVDGNISIDMGQQSHETSRFKVAGLCTEAEDITGCVSNTAMSYVSRGTASVAYIYLFSLCISTKNISKSASLGSIKIDNKPYVGAYLGNVREASSVQDCAFYTTVYGTFPTMDKYGSKIFYNPLGELDGDIGEVKRVVLFNGDDAYFHTPDSKYMSRVDVKKTDKFSDYYESDVAGLSAEDVLSTLNSGDTQTTVWGKVLDDSSALNGCPLPVACGGQFEKNMLQGEGTAESPYLIGSEEELRYLSKAAVDFSGKHFALTADIDMSASEPFEGIGVSKAFSGTFNGNGHVISNVNLSQGGLFGSVTGKVENLAVVNAEVSQPVGKSYTYYYGVIAREVADGGTVQNCYVGGDIAVKGIPVGMDKLPCVGAICGGFDMDSQNPVTTGIYNCYFKGSISVSDVSEHFLFGGLVGSGMGNGVIKPYFKISDCYASFTVPGYTGTVYGLCGGSYVTITNSYSVCPQMTSDKLCNGTVCSSDSEIFAGREFTDADPWIRGAYRPVLKTTRLYKVTAADGSDNEMYIDAIPMTDSSNPSNDILHYTAKDGDETDKVLWALPNLAIYTGADKSEYILNCTLDPTKPFGYNLKKSCPAEAVYVNMHYPLAVSDGRNFEMLCLPGTVTHDCLPEGCALLVGGKGIEDSYSKTTMYMAAVDSVPAGVPFMLYMPDEVLKADSTLDIVMRSRMAIEPLKSITTDGGKTQEFDLTGTFSGVVAKNACNTDDADKYYWDSNADNLQLQPKVSCTARPFTSYIDERKGTVTFTRSLYLSDTSARTGELLENCDGKNLSVSLDRSLKTGSWNTICLPFSMTAAEVESTFGEGTLLEELGSVTVDADGGCTLRFTSATNGIEAGKSYLIKPTKSSSSMYNLAARAISNKLADTQKSVLIGGDNATVTFCGTFERKLLGDSDADEYFTQANTIYHVADGQHVVMNGFRAYIIASKAAAAAMAKARMVHSNGSTTDLHLVEVGSSADGKQRVYDLQGVEHNANGAQQHGVYIKGGRKYVK